MSRAIIFFLGILLVATGCNGSSTSDHKFTGDYPIKVACTTGMVADVLRNVGGKHVEVDQLMGHGVDPHLYKATTADVNRLNRADAIFYSGLHLEGQMGDIFKNLERTRFTCGVADRLDANTILEDDGKAHDPHVWFDVALWSKAAGVVCDALVSFDPKHAADYKANAQKYQAELEALHNEVKNDIATIPKERRVLVTSHDAFRYFGAAYDIEVRGIQGISTETEAGLKNINDLVAFIAERKVKAVFVETSVNERNMESVLNGCMAKGHSVVIGGRLFSDAMGQTGTPEGTYVGMVRHNVKTIVSALK